MKKQTLKYLFILFIIISIVSSTSSLFAKSGVDKLSDAANDVRMMAITSILLANYLNSEYIVSNGTLTNLTQAKEDHYNNYKSAIALLANTKQFVNSLSFSLNILLVINAISGIGIAAVLFKLERF